MLDPLGSYLGGMIGQESPGVGDINSILGGNSPYVSSMIDSLTESLISSSLRTFNKDVRPQIEGSFANIGGTMSSRRGQAINDSLTRLSLDAQDNVTQMIPNLVNTALSGVGQREQLRYLPTQQALSFALQPTRQVAQQPAGKGWDFLGDMAGGAGMGIAALFG